MALIYDLWCIVRNGGYERTVESVIVVQSFILY